jgi:hypothetical protein
MDDWYWNRHPGGPFATLIRIATTYLHPEADGLESLQARAQRAGDPVMQVFKAELRQAIRHPGLVPDGELFRHVQYDDGSPQAFARRLWRDLYGNEPHGAPGALLDADSELRDRGTGELLAMVARTDQSVLRRGRALLELGRRASADPALLRDVAGLIRDPENRRLLTVGTVTVSQLGTAGLVAGGGRRAAVLARELAAEWPDTERSSFAWLMTSAGIAWAP